MIRITFTEPETAKWRAWGEQCTREQERLNRSARCGETWAVKGDVYRGRRYGIKREVFMSFDGPFAGKCAYCEQIIAGDQHGDMEHFRPKKEVRDAENRPVSVVIDGQARKHPAYYWLAYDWRNLLPSCRLCNKQPSDEEPYGKGNRFPVAGEYAVQEGEEQDEKALLLNPVDDDPDEHLNLNELGILDWKTDRGEACVKILGLNERGLPDARREQYHDGRDSYGLLLQALAVDPTSDQAQRLRNKALNTLKGKSEYSIAGRKGIADAKSGTTLAP